MPKRWPVRAAVLGTTGFLLVPLAAGTASAGAANDGGGDRIVVTATPTAPTAAGSDSRAAAACNVFNRTGVCWNTRLTVTLYRNTTPVGQVFGTLTQVIELNMKSRAFSERFALHTDRIVGSASGVFGTIAVSCGGGCKASPSGISGKVLRVGSTINGKIGYSDSVRKGKAHSSPTHYTMTFTKAGYVPTKPAVWNSPLKFRCDDAIGGLGAGCVFPAYTPTLTSMRSLRFISQNIRNLQKKGAPKLLHRNSKLTTSNRRAVCGPAKLPRGWKPPAGWPKPLSDKKNKPSCDEYAFAGTNEGGKKPHNGYAWVPKRENDSQGGKLIAFYKAWRVLDATSARGQGDAFYVSV
ncbi:NucA/NucB deoxyribonuclease domain-containing protein [Actinomadura gamaensis]|uniref:NucA/NucB deoxyribonuclease domain-containing protein n=1 Tax=Actinomadura gamaensis TaxID=1763541 RepID=A0ABV9TZF2_9ACTN